MKKSSLLSLLTAAAIVTTSAGTYAAWDTLAPTTEVALTYGKPVTVAYESITAPGTLGGIDGENSRDISIPVTIKSENKDYVSIDDKKVTLTATKSNGDLLTGVSVAFKDDAGTPLVSGVDMSPKASKTYKATVTLVNSDNSTEAAQDAKIKITATLSKK